MRDIINVRIKLREKFRPFRASVASKRSTTSSSVPWRTRSCFTVYPVRPEQR
jgi:predicted NodU family carbamoyl transferase